MSVQDLQIFDISELDLQSDLEMANTLSPSSTGSLIPHNVGTRKETDPIILGGRSSQPSRMTQYSMAEALQQREHRSATKFEAFRWSRPQHRLDPSRIRSIVDQFRESLNQQTIKKNEQEWLSKNREKYRGQWIALNGDQLLANSSSSSEVITVARNARPRPLVMFIEPSDRPFAGW